MKAKLTEIFAPIVCPHCKRMNDVTSGFDGTAPRVGDASICFACGEVSTFGDDLYLRKPTMEESAKFSKDPLIKLIQETMRQVKLEKEVK